MFDANFVRQLNQIAWVPDATGALQQPGLVVFESLGWKANPFLLSKIRFKPPIIETLAKEAGIEPGVLDLLKKHNLTSVAELLSRLGIDPQPETPGSVGSSGAEDAAEGRSGETLEPNPHVSDPSGHEAPSSNGSRGAGDATGEATGSRVKGSSPEGMTHEGPSSSGDTADLHEGESTRSPGSSGGRPLISYVGVNPDEEERDPDGLNQQARMALEAKAIQLILKSEPQLQRTPTNNPGYDLYEAGSDGQPERWIEVKSMTGNLHDRPVGLTRTQFECAREKGEAYWLYVVENAGADNGARIVRIQDPAGTARSFTFDRGWLAVADVDGIADMNAEEEDREE